MMLSRQVKAARRSYKMSGGDAGPRARENAFFDARLIQEKARERAVLKNLDGGTTIKESRDIDLRWSAAHCFISRLGPISGIRFYRTESVGPSASRAKILPWNLPLLMAAWLKTGASNGLRNNTVVLKPSGDDFDHRSPSRRNFPRGPGCPMEWSTS